MTQDIMSHPERELLTSYGLGKLEPEEAARIEQHVTKCESCLEILAAVSSDSFLQKVQEVPESSAASEPNTQTGTGSTVPEEVKSEKDSSGEQQALKETVIGDCSDTLLDHPEYQIIQRLGSGGMGEIYLARHKLMGRLEALKTIKRDYIESPGAIDRFMQEIQSAARLNHPNVVSANHAFIHDGQLVFSMEYVDGRDLGELLREGRPFSVNRACFFFMQAAAGLQHAHENGLIHRDIKPNNLIVFRHGKKWGLKLLDFGLAKAMSEQEFDGRLTQTGAVIGTLLYIAPEQARGAEHADIRSDIYSLGCSLYHVLAGRPPFLATNKLGYLEAHLIRTAEPLHTLRPDVPVALSDVIAKMMAKEPEKRFQTPKEVAAALKEFVKPSSRTEPQELNLKTPEATLSGTLDFETLTESQINMILVPDNESSATLERLRAGRSQRKSVGWGNIALVSVGFCFLLASVLWSTGIFPQAESTGTIVINNIPPGSEVFVDGERIDFEATDISTQTEIDSSVGSHSVLVKKDGFHAFGENIRVTSGEQIELDVRLAHIGSGEADSSGSMTQQETSAKPPTELVAVRDEKGGAIRRDPTSVGNTSPSVFEESQELPIVTPSSKTHENSGFVQLFNGKTLDGWETHESQPGDWFVSSNGTLTGTWRGPSYLYSQKTYSCFHLRLEAKINEKGNSGVYFRSSFGPERPADAPITPWGNEAQIYAGSGPHPVTGTLHIPDENDQVRTTRKTTYPDQWFEMEVFAHGRHIQVTVDGEIVADYIYPDDDQQAGRIALQVANEDTVVEFRKIEIKELASSVIANVDDLPESVTTMSVAEFDSLFTGVDPASTETKHESETKFISLFNGKNLEGWETHPSQPGDWSVTPSGILVGKGKDVSHLYTTRSYTDFHLRAEVRINEGGNSGICGRAVFGPAYTTQRPTWLKAYESEIYSDNAGRLFVFGEGYKGSGVARPVAPDNWFEMEMIARDNHIVVKVNGRTTADYRETGEYVKSGRIALQMHDENTVVEFRKIEVKELSSPDSRNATAQVNSSSNDSGGLFTEPGSRSENETAKASGEFTPLFNGDTLDGWETHPSQPGGWSVTSSGILVGKGKNVNQLYTTRSFTDFHLRAEARINKGGHSGICGRALFGPVNSKQRPTQLTACETQIYSDSAGRIFMLGKGFKTGGESQPVAPQNWFEMEMIARDNHIVVRINGKTTADYYHTGEYLKSGRIALQMHDENTTVEFRRIEVKDLSSENATVDASEEVDLLTVGSVWKGSRTYQQGKLAGLIVPHTLTITERNGNVFKGGIQDHGPENNFSPATGVINGEQLQWTQYPQFRKGTTITMTGTLTDNVLQMTFHSTYVSGATSEGTASFTRQQM
ncbi:MAG: hypothetical protein CMJ46_05415 [Planctomyces sp.]|nr:hypothetical protein [Planctomyces sp.]